MFILFGWFLLVVNTMALLDYCNKLCRSKERNFEIAYIMSIIMEAMMIWFIIFAMLKV